MPCLVEGASLDCLVPFVVGCGDFAESEAVFLCSLSLPKTESGHDETFLPRKMQECDKECKQAGVLANNYWLAPSYFQSSCFVTYSGYHLCDIYAFVKSLSNIICPWS